MDRKTTAFESYFTERIKDMNCSAEEESAMRQILYECALNSLENENVSESLWTILRCRYRTDSEQSALFEMLKQTGMFSEDMSGLHWCQQDFQNCLAALGIAERTDEQRREWLNHVVHSERYAEVIGCLAGILFDRNEQDTLLDTLELKNLRLYMKVLKCCRGLTSTEEEWHLRFVRNFYLQILQSYDRIMVTHFKEIYPFMDGYCLERTGKPCIRGKVDFIRRKMTVCIYNGSDQVGNVAAMISDHTVISICTVDHSTPEPPKLLDVKPSNPLVYHYSLDVFAHGVDFAREIAIRMIKVQLRYQLYQMAVLDMPLNVLVVERLENELRCLRKKKWASVGKERMSLYRESLDTLFNWMKNLSECHEEAIPAGIFCMLLSRRQENVGKYLDIQPDLAEPLLMYQDCLDAYYSDAQFLKKMERIFTLSEQAIHRIVTELIPALSTVRPTTRKIVMIHRQDRNVSYIEVKVNDGEEMTPILTLTDAPAGTCSELHPYYKEQLCQIGKEEKDICGYQVVELQNYLRENIFHMLIYEEMDAVFKRFFEV